MTVDTVLVKGIGMHAYKKLPPEYYITVLVHFVTFVFIKHLLLL